VDKHSAKNRENKKDRISHLENENIKNKNGKGTPEFQLIFYPKRRLQEC